MAHGFDIEFARPSQASELPDLLYEVIVAMDPTGSVPAYFLPVDWVITGDDITAQGIAALYQGAIGDVEGRADPNVAIDGRLMQLMGVKWSMELDDMLSQIEAIIPNIQDSSTKLAVAYGYDKVVAFMSDAAGLMGAAVQRAAAAQVPLWSDPPFEGPAIYPVLIMVTRSQLMAWVTAYVEVATLLVDARKSLEADAPVGIVQEYEVESKSVLTGQKSKSWAWVGWVGLGLVAVGTIAGVIVVTRQEEPAQKER